MAIPLACPRCGSPLELTAPDELTCRSDGLCFQREGGIWRMLLPEREGLFKDFIREYETIRLAEGRSSQDPAFYRGLPYRDLTGRLSADWRIRAASYNLLRRFVRQASHRAQTPPLPVGQAVQLDLGSRQNLNLTPPPQEGGRKVGEVYSLCVLDLGAGNGWLSNRLAGMGCRVAAVDLSTNDFDGLGCWRHYETSFTPVQAEFDHLPFQDRLADLVVFNASLHYSTSFLLTLREARRVLTPTGRLFILDSPIYHDPASGRQMVREREEQFKKKYGFPSNAMKSENYLTYARLRELGEALKIEWKLHTPFYGWRWLLRPLIARLRGKREPARFHLIEGRIIGASHHQQA